MTDDPAVRVRAWLDAPTWLPDAADDLRAVLAELLEYRNAITWETSCLSCSRMLDACRTADERAEKAEAELAENTGVLQALRRQRDTAEEQMRRARALHRPDMSGHCCEGCWDYDGSPELYPCPTIRALDEETPA